MAYVCRTLGTLLQVGMAALAVVTPAAADIAMSEWVIVKGNTIEVLGPDGSVDLQGLVDGITDASATNRYLIQLGPGIYTLPGGETLVLKEYVDLRGSGQEATEIVGDRTSGGGSCGSLAGHGVLATADNSVLSDLAVTHDSSSSSTGYALCNKPDESPTIRRVTARVVSDSSGGARHTIHLDGGSPLLADVTVVGEGGDSLYGLYCNSGDPVVSRARIEIRDGVVRNRGIWLVGTCNLEMTALDLIAEDSPTNRGIDQQTGTDINLAQAWIRTTGSGDNAGMVTRGDGTAILHDVRIRTSGGTSNTGIDMGDTAFLRLFRSTVSGGASAVVYDSTTAGYAAQSTIFGGASGSGDLSCVAADNGLGDALADDCTEVP